MKRFGIYNYYNKNGWVDKATLKTLNDLKSVVSYLVVVINGIIADANVFRDIADELIFRPNRGYDQGAYKTIICSTKYQPMIRQCDELVLCNSGFYGPFIPFEKIFYLMNQKDCDFWGLALHEHGLVKYIESYFLVFRKKVIEEEKIYKYFNDCIDEDTSSFEKVYFEFEHGLFNYLENIGYKGDALSTDIAYNCYINPYGFISQDKVPILKKKVFTDQYYDREKMLESLSYIRRNYNYNMKILIESIQTLYAIDFEYKNIDDYISMGDIPDKDYDSQYNFREKLHTYIYEHDNIYIYGTGMRSCTILCAESPYFWRKKLKGYIVSDSEPKVCKHQCIYAPVYWLSEIKTEDIELIVALNKHNFDNICVELGKHKFKAIYYATESE